MDSRRQNRSSALPIAAVLSFAALSVVSLASGPAGALVGGTADRAGAFAAVVLILGGPGNKCSATKIGPRRFLTAAHCVVDTGDGELLPSYRHGAALRISNAPFPRAAVDFIQVGVEQTRLAPGFEQGLRRFIAHKEARIAEFREQLAGSRLQRRIEGLKAGHHFTARFPDAAVVTLETDTVEIPEAPLDLTPLRQGDPITLVGYGCEDLSKPAATAADHPLGHRRFGASHVIRIDPVNFYSYGRVMRPEAPSLCPGDSGGPVLRGGRVVGIHNTAYGVARRHGAKSNMSVNLSSLATWPALSSQ